jgi:DNA-binding NarL/FixJ family response regulator
MVMTDAGIGSINLKVLVFDSDFYALQAINSYLAWDRRTRVKRLCETLEEVWNYLARTPAAELPDMVVMDADRIGGTTALASTIARLRDYIQSIKKEDVKIICLAQYTDTALVETAANVGASAFLLKQEVSFRIAWALVFALEQDFVVTPAIAKACDGTFNTRIFHAAVLPERRTYPEMTDRIEQAIKLCVVEGMPAHLAADEMGISLHTIRGYIKEGYRIMEAYDDTEYPIDMTPQERAFMRFTALEDDAEVD